MMEEINDLLKSCDDRYVRFNFSAFVFTKQELHRLIELVEEEQVEKCISRASTGERKYIEKAPRVSDALKAEEV